MVLQAQVERSQQVDIHLLHPHPYNQKIYGNEDVSELAARIKASNWIKPIVVTQNNRIISGHRRWQSALLLGYASVPIERRTFTNELEELEALLLENQFRDKTPEQRVREGETWKKIEDEKALQRKQAAMLSVNTALGRHQSTIQENFPESSQGQVRDKVAERVGFGSGKTYEKATQVVKTADRLAQTGKKAEADALLKVLNTQSVDAASKVLKMTEPVKVAVLETIATKKAHTVKDALRVAKEETRQEDIKKDLELAEKEQVPLHIVKEARTAVQNGQLWRLGKHLLYCGDSSSQTFIAFAKEHRASFAFADPPYNAGVAEWDHDFTWQHDYLIDIAPIVVVTPGIASIYSFMRTTTMPYKWSLSYWIDNGMTRGALGFGNWIYAALFSQLQSIYRNAQDHERVSIASSDRDELEHKGRKPLAMMRHLVRLFAQEKEIVLDPFLGSGSTLIACELTQRICVGAEINPDYCESIIRRWETITELQGELTQWL